MKIIKLSGVVGYEITAKGLEAKFPRDKSDVHLKIDSVGGSVFEGNRLYNAILDYPGKITVELGAIAASAASYFPMAAGIENISVRENTTFMGHKAWTFAIGNADDMKAEAEILDGFDKIIAKAYNKATGKDIDELLADMGNEFWLIGGKSVVDAGFASSVVDGESEDDEETEIVDKAEIVAKIQEAKNNLRDIEAKEDLGKWAAKIETTLNTVDVDEEGQTLLFSEAAPQGGAKNNMEDFNMSLKEILEKNPEAKAEYKAELEAARAEGNENAVKADRERVAEITTLFGNSEQAIKAIAEGLSVGELAVSEKKASLKAVETQAKDPVDFGGVSTKDQLPAKVETEEKTDTENKLDSAIDSIVGKKEAK